MLVGDAKCFLNIRPQDYADYYGYDHDEKRLHECFFWVIDYAIGNKSGNNFWFVEIFSHIVYSNTH